MIREARIHFAAVLEECRIAGLDTSAIAEVLSKLNTELDDSIRPELWERVEQPVAHRAAQMPQLEQVVHTHIAGFQSEFWAAL